MILHKPVNCLISSFMLITQPYKVLKALLNDNIRNDNLESLINDKLLKITEWLKINKLSLNIAKSKYMAFQKANKNVQKLTLKIDNINIEKVKELSFLGLIIDTNFNWKRHTEKMSNASSKKIGILNKLKHVITTN